MDGHAADVLADQLALAGVHADADLDAELPRLGGDRERAPQRARGRAFEGREKAVAYGLDLATPEAQQLLADGVVVTREEIAPAAITDLCGTRGGVDDVREHDRQQRPREAAAAAGPGEELLDLLEDRVHVAHERKRVVALELDVAGPGYVLGQVARVASVPDELSAPVHDQRRHTDARQLLAHVEVDGCSAHRSRLARARGEALQAREPGSKGRVIRHRGREQGERGVAGPAPDGRAGLGCRDARLPAPRP